MNVVRPKGQRISATLKHNYNNFYSWKKEDKKQYLKVKSTHRDVWFSIAVHVFFLCVTMMIFLKRTMIINWLFNILNAWRKKSENFKKENNNSTTTQKIMKTRSIEQKKRIEEKKLKEVRISNYISRYHPIFKN